MTERSAPRVHLASLGCAKNLVDSERILGRLAAAGAVVGAAADEADVIIVNTCGFIDSAKEESVETILRLAEYRKRGPCRTLIVMGCLAQRYAESLREQLPEVDGLFGLGEEEGIVRAAGLRPERREPGRLLLTPKHTAYVRISEGCDNCCAYCAIPLIRGRFRSRPAEEVLREAHDLVASGARELNVIGQDTSLYGADLPGSPRIHDLLRSISAVPRLRWLRLLYTHPAHFSPELIEAYASVPKLLPYVDLPLQHLNDEVLRRMRRRVTQADILDLIGRLRDRVPGVAIRTAFIVGFPGETRAQFNEMLRLVRALRFDHLGAFAYSREEDTPAARMSGQATEATKKRRLRELMLAQQEIVAGCHRAMRGKTVELLVERPAGNEPNVWVARSATQAPDVDSVTYVSGARLKAGQFVKAVITGGRGYDLLASPVES